MHNLLILYNPHYEANVIQAHLEILKSCGKVAFGKIVSKMNKNPAQEFLTNLAQSVDSENALQLFLTDYASLFVAKVEQITKDCDSAITPKYYEQKNLSVEFYFIITDLRQIVSSDFETIRDKYLANFRTPHYGNHTYALYGNEYIYPLQVKMKDEVNYFEASQKYYPNVYKTPEQLAVQECLRTYCFGEFWESMQLDSREFLVSAEMEYDQNKLNALYDFTSVIVKYSKIFEKELHLLLQEFFRILGEKDEEILNTQFSMQGVSYTIKDIFETKFAMGSYKHLLYAQAVRDLSESDKTLRSTRSYVVYLINKLQSVRNESVHQRSATLDDVQKLRNTILGIGEESAISRILKDKKELQKKEL